MCKINKRQVQGEKEQKQEDNDEDKGVELYKGLKKRFSLWSSVVSGA